MANARERYWIPQMRQQVKSIIGKCVRCQRFNSRPFMYPNMKDIPKARVIRSRPFENIGLDYFGPMQYKKSNGMLEKCWGAIITCSTTRMIYLDIAKDVKTDTFLMILRRFFAIHGIPKSVVSDNAPTFLLGKSILQSAFSSNTPSDDVRSFCMERNIDWKNITAYAPWQGGFYERLIRSVKLALNKCYGRRVLSFEELKTVIHEVAGSLNARPLTYVDEEDVILPVRPIDFLAPEIEIKLPELQTVEDKDEYRTPEEVLQLRTRSETLEALKSSTERADQIWKVWQTEYLRELRNKQKLRMDSRRGAPKIPKTGQIVLVTDEVLPRNVWKMGRITEVIADRDGTIREVKLKTMTNREIARPVNLVVPLEMDDPETGLEKVPDEVPRIDSIERIENSTSPEEVPEKKENKMSHRYNLRQHKKINYAEDSEDEMQNLDSRMNAVHLKEESSNPRKQSIKSTLYYGIMPNTWLKLAMMVSMIMMVAGQDDWIKCTSQGISIDLRNRGTLQVCSKNGCETFDPSSKIFKGQQNLDVWIPPEIKSKSHRITVKTMESNEVQVTKKLCKRVSMCDTITCTFCVENILNPTCSPVWSTVSTSTLVYLVLFFIYCICFVPVSLCSPIFMVFGFVRLMFWIIKKLLQCCYQPVRMMAQRRKRAMIQSRKDRINQALLAITILLTIIGCVQACQEVDVMDEQNKVCVSMPNGNEKCSIRSKELMKLNSNSRKACIRVSKDNQTAQEIQISWTKMNLHCQKETLLYTRNIQMKTLSAKRCNYMGSCVNAKCGNITSDSLIPELEDANRWPGNTGCVESCGGFGCNCLSFSSGCLFYRVYAKPTNDEIYELLRCTGYKESLEVKIKTLIYGKNVIQEKKVEMFPNVPVIFNSFAVTLMDVHTPHLPILEQWFIKNENETSIWDANEVPPMRCLTSDAAKKLDCELESNCKCESAESTMMCKCKPTRIEERFRRIHHRFPVITPEVNFIQKGDEIVAEVEEDTSATISISFQEKVELRIMEIEDKCEARVEEIHGCYRCQSGAEARIKCTSQKSSTIGKLTCDEMDTYIIQCTPEGQTSSINIHAENAKLKKSCTLTCGQGSEKVRILGILKFESNFHDVLRGMLKGDIKVFNELKFPDIGFLYEFHKFFIYATLAIFILIGIGLIITYTVVTGGSLSALRIPFVIVRMIMKCMILAIMGTIKTVRFLCYFFVWRHWAKRRSKEDIHMA